MKRYLEYLTEEKIKNSDVIDIATLNFSKLYSEFNQKYFKSKLPQVPIVLKPLKNIGGQVKHKNNVVYIMEISNFLETTKERIYGILVHEMIHIWIYNEGLWEQAKADKGHGKAFMDKLKEVNKKTPFEVPRYDDQSKLQVSKYVKPKLHHVVLISYDGAINKIVGKGYQMMLFSKPLSNSTKQTLQLRYGWKPEHEVTYYKSKESLLMKYKASPNLNRNTKIQMIPPELGKMIEKNGTMVEPIYPDNATVSSLSDKDKKMLALLRGKSGMGSIG